eukprot:767761-Hanusia_phi.AAC.1
MQSFEFRVPRGAKAGSEIHVLLPGVIMKERLSGLKELQAVRLPSKISAGEMLSINVRISDRSEKLSDHETSDTKVNPGRGGESRKSNTRQRERVACLWRGTGDTFESRYPIPCPPSPPATLCLCLTLISSIHLSLPPSLPVALFYSLTR